MKRKSIKEKVDEALAELADEANKKMQFIRQNSTTTGKLSIQDWSELARLMKPFRLEGY